MNNIELDMLIPAFLAGLLVLATHVPLGMKILARGIIFADLAVAQIAGLGVITAGFLEVTEYPLVVQIIAASSAIFGAILLAIIEQKLPEVQEACIGLLFVLAASGNILLMNHSTHTGEHLQNLLLGQILLVSNNQLFGTLALTAVLLASWRILHKRSGNIGFYVLFALAVTASVQLVGVYLVFASLIIPALATYRMQQHRMLTASLIGVTGYTIGLWLSVWADLPSGATIIWVMAMAGALVMLKNRANLTV
ncbi:MAG: metal ABC transporter permease [Candidatus Nitrotoga sp.]